MDSNRPRHFEKFEVWERRQFERHARAHVIEGAIDCEFAQQWQRHQCLADGVVLAVMHSDAEHLKAAQLAKGGRVEIEEVEMVQTLGASSTTHADEVCILRIRECATKMAHEDLTPNARQ